MNDRTTGTKPIAILLVAVVALAAMAGVAAAAGDLGVTVDDAEGEPTVTVTENDTAVENATVNVTVADPANESYAGAGEYTTDENGTVTLDTPEEGVTVDVTATADNQSASTTVDLEAPVRLALDVAVEDGEPVVSVTDDGDAVENASVNVTTADGQNVTYAGNGTYETDENGTVALPAPEENVTVNVAATVGNESISATVDLTVEEVEEPVAEEPMAEDRPFGQFVRDFIDRVSNREGGIGAAVSDFVRENNPGNAPDDAGASGGPNDAAGNASDGDSNAGNAPDQAGNGNGNENGNGNSGEQGPPEHAGPNGDDNAESDDAESERGPPDHAGPGGDDADGDDDTDDAEEADESDDADDDADESDDADENGSDAGDDDTGAGSDDDTGGSGAADSSGGSSSGNGNGPGNGNGRP